MSSVMKKLRNKRSRRDEFQITASAQALVLECQKKKWHPCKLSIIWNKEKPKSSSTKPVPWQGDFKNPYSGIIVWPEPDPVKTKLTLIKNSDKKLYQYQDKPWQVLVQNVSPSGKWKVIAVGSLDISDYIMEESTSHDITVTLKPVKKTVLSGSLEFTLSSVILEDGVPYRTDKEIFDEIMNDAIAELERKKSPQKAKKSNGQVSKSSSQKASGCKAPVSDTATCDSQEAASCSHSNIAGEREVESKALCNLPPLHAASQSASLEPLLSQPSPSSHCDVKEVNSSLSQSEEKTSNKRAAKYLQERDAFGKKKPDDRESSLSWENDLCEETTLKDAKLSDGECVNKNPDQAVQNNILTKNGDTSFSKNDSRDDDRGITGPLKAPLAQNETVLKKAKRRVHLVRKKLKRAKGKELSKPKEGDDGHRSTPGQALPLSDGHSHCETRSIPSADTSPSRKGAPFNQEEIASDTTDPEASTPGDAAGSRTVVIGAVPEKGFVVKDVESSNLIQKNKSESETVSPISQHCPELSVYIREETFLLQHEIASLEKVITKLEQEIQEAKEMKVKGVLPLEAKIFDLQMENSSSNETTSGAPTSEFASRTGVWYWVLRGLIGLIILAGNGAVIYVIVTCHRLHKAANWFILSLSWADLFVGLFLIPVSTSCALWTTCNFSVLTLSFDLLLVVSIANMCAMTADRYLSVVKPLTYFQNMTNSRVFLWISVSWIVPILFSLIPFAWIFTNSPAKIESAFEIYGTLQIIIFNLLPCVVMLLIYGHIFIISRKHARQIRALTKHQHLSQPQMTFSPRQVTQERSATRVFGLVVLFFVLCWMLSAYRHFCQYFSLKCSVSFELTLISRLLMVTNSAINPFIYAFLKEDIKREVKKLLCRHKPRTVSFNTHSPSVHSHRQRGERSNDLSIVVNA